MKAKKTVALSLALALLICIISIPVTAAPIQGIVTPQWTNTSTVECKLGFTGRVASCVAQVTGNSGTTKIESVLTLYKKNGTSWDYVTSWSQNSTTQSVTYSKTYKVDSAGTYKLTIDATVYRNGTGEPVSKSVEKSCT